MVRKKLSELFILSILPSCFFIFLSCVNLYGAEFPFQQEGENRVGHLKIEMERSIDQSTYLYVKFALEHFAKEQCSAIVLELNTPGGEVFAAQKIAHLLKKSPIPVIAYLNDWAISAGAMLAYACPYIVLSPSASMGAAEPVFMKGNGMESAPEKVNSALRAEFANLAAFFGRNSAIAEAMVDKDLILVRREGEIVKLDSESDIRAGEDEVLSPKGKLLTLNAKQLMEFGISDWQTAALFEEIPHLKQISFHNWKVDFFAFLAHPFIASLLMMGLMLAFYLEIQMGGFGIPACGGLLCLGLLLLSHFSLAAIDWLEPIFLGLGALLLVLEFFVFPTWGVMGALGAVLFLVGLFTLGQPDWKEVHFSWDVEKWNLAAYSVYKGLGWFCGSLLFSILLMFFFSRVLLPRSPLFRKLVPYEEPLPLPALSLPQVQSMALACSDCRPAGLIEVDGEIYEAFSEEGFIDKGERVIIVRIENKRILIRPCSSSQH